MSFQITPQSGSVTTIARLNIRSGMASTAAAIARKVEAGTPLEVSGVLSGEPVKGNDQWYAGPGNVFFWSGACSDFRLVEAPTASPMQVIRRPNGTIKPLSEAQLRAVFGDLNHTEASGGSINVDPAWTQANMATAQTPALDRVGQPTLQVHRKAVGAFERVFAAIADAGLAGRVITFDGLWVPRHKTWNPARTLSSHSWAVAIDLNSRWNGYGVEPAAIGTHGSVRELVPFFAAEGFAWGGHFSGSSVDGMHFELARLDL